MITAPNIFNFLLDFFNMLISWGNSLWLALTHEFKVVIDGNNVYFQLWEALAIIGGVAMVIIWLIKIFI